MAEEYDEFDDEQPREGLNPTFAYVAMGLLFVIAVVLAIVTWSTTSSKNRLADENDKQKKNISSLQSENKEFKSRIMDLDEKQTILIKQAQELEEQRDYYRTQRDDLKKQLAYSRTNERNSKVKIAALEKKLRDTEAKLADIQDKYDQLLASSGNTSVEMQARIQQLTSERNKLAEDNQKLRRDLEAATGNADNRTAIFSTSMLPVPGEIKRGKFSSSRRSQNIDRLQVSFTLSRPPKPTENLIFKVFDNTNKEIPIKPQYRNELNAPANPTNQKVILEFANGFLERRDGGNFSVRLYLTDVNKGLENQEIGLKEFEVK